MKKLLLLCLLFPIFVLAQAEDIESEGEAVPEDVLFVGGLEISYDTQYEVDGGVMYYQWLGEVEEDDERLVASTHDVDGDEAADPELWLVYADNKVVVEAHDTTGDGVPDIFVNLNDVGDVESITGDKAETVVPAEATKFIPDVPQASDGVNTKELVGDLSDITVEKEDYSWMLFVVMLLAGGLFYFFFKRQK